MTYIIYIYSKLFAFKRLEIKQIKTKKFIYFFHFSKGSATALTVGAPPIVESFSLCPIYNLQIRPRQVQFCHKITYFAILQNFIFWHPGVVLKPLFLKFSQKWKKISTNGLFQRITFLAHHQRVPDHHDTKMTQKIIRSKKHIFRPPRQTKKIIYLLPSIFLNKMHLLHLIITHHFTATCQFSFDSNGPVLRTWIFSRSSLYIFEKKNQNFWNF